MSDDVQITKVERVGSSRRKRKRSTVYTDTLDVVNIENIPEVSCVENIPEVSCVELPQEPYVHVDSDDDAVVITSVSKRSKVANFLTLLVCIAMLHTYMLNYWQGGLVCFMPRCIYHRYLNSTNAY